jgi:pimeloyl-ACP methyl ester carboxylesterase
MSILTIFRLLSFIVIDFTLIVLFAPIGLIYLLFGPKSKTDGDQIIILIHGSSVSDWQWAIAKFYLYISGLSFISVKYNSSQSINESRNQVLNQINLRDKDIIIIGHSQGGLIARKIHNQLGSKMTFLMNTPQKGASLINWLGPETLEPSSRNDMRVGSEFIKNLPNVNSETIHEIVGINDFVRDYEATVFGVNVYKSWFGHYFNAVNPYLWFSYVIPKIKSLMA